MPLGLITENFKSEVQEDSEESILLKGDITAKSCISINLISENGIKTPIKTPTKTPIKSKENSRKEIPIKNMFQSTIRKSMKFVDIKNITKEAPIKNSVEEDKIIIKDKKNDKKFKLKNKFHEKTEFFETKTHFRVKSQPKTPNINKKTKIYVPNPMQNVFRADCVWLV